MSTSSLWSICFMCLCQQSGCQTVLHADWGCCAIVSQLHMSVDGQTTVLVPGDIAVFNAPDINSLVTISVIFNWDSMDVSYCPGCIRQILFGVSNIQHSCQSFEASTYEASNILSVQYTSDGTAKSIKYSETLDYGCIQVENEDPRIVVGTITAAPTPRPTFAPTLRPTFAPTLRPTFAPTLRPTFAPTPSPTALTSYPTFYPTSSPTSGPTAPTFHPTFDPTSHPTNIPTKTPTKTPTEVPTTNPTTNPTKNPTTNPTKNPSFSPTMFPTFHPFILPTTSPTFNPSIDPTIDPTFAPTLSPTLNPSPSPSEQPSAAPTLCYGAKYEQIMSNDDCLWSDELLVSSNCLCQLKVQSNGHLVLLGKSKAIVKVQSTNLTHISGVDVAKLELTEYGLVLNQYPYKNVPAFLPNEMWSVKVNRTNVTLYLSLDCCLKLTALETVIWDVCAQSEPLYNTTMWNVTDEYEHLKQESHVQTTAIVWIVIVLLIIMAALWVVFKRMRELNGFSSPKANQHQHRVVRNSTIQMENQITQAITEWMNDPDDHDDEDSEDTDRNDSNHDTGGILSRVTNDNAYYNTHDHLL
eukprot:194696_1